MTLVANILVNISVTKLLTSEVTYNVLFFLMLCFMFFLYFYIILLECFISIANRKYVIDICRQFSVDVQHKFVLEVSSKAYGISSRTWQLCLLAVRSSTSQFSL